MKKLLLFCILFIVSCGGENEDPFSDPIETLQDGLWAVESLTVDGDDQTELWQDTRFDFRSRERLSIIQDDVSHDAWWFYERHGDLTANQLYLEIEVEDAQFETFGQLWTISGVEPDRVSGHTDSHYIVWVRVED